MTVSFGSAIGPEEDAGAVPHRRHAPRRFPYGLGRHVLGGSVLHPSKPRQPAASETAKADAGGN